jgi:glutamate racemase
MLVNHFTFKIKLLMFVLGLTSVSSGESPHSAALAPLIEHVQQHQDGRVAYSFDWEQYRKSTADLPIGVFDSGIGGLTVLEAVLSQDAFDNDNLRPGPDGRRDFENERFVYLGDQANMPYGNYAARGKVDFLRELILKDAIFLLGKRTWETPKSNQPSFDKPPVKAIVIACNTATAFGLEDVRRAIQTWRVPVVVIGVVEAGAHGVNELLVASDLPKSIAVLATVGTCSSMAYPKAIGGVTGLAGKRAPHVIQQGSVSLAGAIEGDPAFTTLTNRSQSDAIAACIREDVTTLVERYRQSGKREPIEMVVLGCTHFPFVQDEILSAFQQLRQFESEESGDRPYETLIAEQLQIVNPAELTAKELFRQLALQRIRNTDDHSTNRHDWFFLSVPSPSLSASAVTPSSELSTEYKYGRTPGNLDLEDTRFVPMLVDQLPTASRQLVERRLPEVWKRLMSTH